jgi:hypothetical protein
VSDINVANRAGQPKPGPKGRVLEPYARDVLLMHREGRSMQDIVNWLSDPSRGVTITRQAVHAWLKARIKKLVRLSSAYENTGIVGPFRNGYALQAQRPSEKAGGPDPPRPGPLPSSSHSRSATVQPGTQPDDKEFMVDAFEFRRDQNPMKHKINHPSKNFGTHQP